MAATEMTMLSLLPTSLDHVIFVAGGWHPCRFDQSARESLTLDPGRSPPSHTGSKLYLVITNDSITGDSPEIVQVAAARANVSDARASVMRRGGTTT